MALPARATPEDAKTLCSFLSKRPTGATLLDAKAVVDQSILNPYKLDAYESWNLVEKKDGRYLVTDLGRKLARGSDSEVAAVFGTIIHDIGPYLAAVERVHHKGETEVPAADVASHWHRHFNDDSSSNEDVLNQQAVCFFQAAQAAGLGTLVVGRKGSPTRLQFDRAAVQKFLENGESTSEQFISEPGSPSPTAHAKPLDDSPGRNGHTPSALGQAIFVAHGKNKKPLEQLKRVLDQFKISYKVALDEPNLGRPIGEKVRATMQQCNCAILLFTADEEFQDRNGNTIWRPSENVVHELGAAAYLYDDRIVIMKEQSVVLPSNFRDLGYISFEKDQLEARAMDILKELIGFGILKVTT